MSNIIIKPGSQNVGSSANAAASVELPVINIFTPNEPDYRRQPAGYYRTYNDKDVHRDIDIFVDEFIDPDNCDFFSPAFIKVALLEKSRHEIPEIYDNIEKFQDRFDFIMTWDREVFEDRDLPNLIPYILGGTTLREEDRKLTVTLKDKNIVYIHEDSPGSTTSEFRSELLDAIKTNPVLAERVDIFESDGTNRLEALQQYRYAIVIEDHHIDDYFSSLLVDCLITGTIPFYYGSPRVQEYFSPQGMFEFHEIDILLFSLYSATEDHYQKRQYAILENAGKAMDEYTNHENYIFDYYLRERLVRHMESNR